MGSGRQALHAPVILLQQVRQTLCVCVCHMWQKKEEDSQARYRARDAAPLPTCYLNCFALEAAHREETERGGES